MAHIRDLLPILFLTEYQSAAYAQSIKSAVKDAQQDMSRAQVRQTRYANTMRRELSFEEGACVLLDSKTVAGHEKLGNRFVVCQESWTCEP